MIQSAQSANLAAGRSILLTTTMTFFSSASALRSTKRVCGMGPSTLSTSSSTPGPGSHDTCQGALCWLLNPPAHAPHACLSGPSLLEAWHRPPIRQQSLLSMCCLHHALLACLSSLLVMETLALQLGCGALPLFKAGTLLGSEALPLFKAGTLLGSEALPFPQTVETLLSFSGVQ